MRTADVVIVGAGLAGCSVARHLAADHRVLLLEQGPQPGAEAAAQNAGMVRRMGEDPYERALAIRTVEALAAWDAVPGPDFPDGPPSRVIGAVLALARDPDHLTDAAAHLRARGLQVEPCDRPADLAPALAGSPLPFAWHLPDARVADAHALVMGALRGARRLGASLRCGVRVTGLRTSGAQVTGVDTDDGPVEAGAVVLAAGAWSAQLARAAGLDRPLVPVRRTLLHTAPHPASAPDHPWTWVDDAGVYARPEAGGWLISGCDEAVDPPAPGPGSQGPVQELHRALAADKLRRWLPALADMRFTGGWTGLRTFAPDRRPVLGADPERPGLWWAAGLGGFGVTCSVAVGEAVAAWMRGHETPWLHRAGVAPGRPLASRWLIRPDGDLHHGRLVTARPPQG
ncbi:MAG: FAD-binding oxidoreductase [Alphaproteobacteria bacterium]|nr:FAD-binding oxidoreductase [Alphaproteobacteria bacterium]